MTKEGFTLLNLGAYPKGNLFQEKVYRFSCSSNDDRLPFHQFTVGDSVRITAAFGDPLSPDSIDGVLLDRRLRYLDICLNSADANKMDSIFKYRLDCMVNRVTYDRQIDALQTFLTPPTVGVLGVSRAVRDIMLYSYPNSMIQLANTPGGLKMALPMTSTTDSPELNMKFEDMRDNEFGNEKDRLRGSTEYGNGNENGDEDELRILSAALEKGRGMTGVKVEQGSVTGTVRNRQRGSEEDDPRNDMFLQKVAHPTQQLQQQLFSNSSRVKIAIDPKTFFNSNNNDNNSSNIRNNDHDYNHNYNYISDNIGSSNSDTLNPLKNSAGKKKLEDNEKITNTENKINSAVFTSNSRLRFMAETFSGNLKIKPYDTDEINTAIESIAKQSPMNESQLTSLKKAINQTITLIQGPPGTGKTRTACSMVAVSVALKNQRLSIGDEQSKGLKLQKILACAHSNIAADNLLEGLVAQNVNVVRLGKFSITLLYFIIIFLLIIHTFLMLYFYPYIYFYFCYYFYLYFICFILVSFTLYVFTISFIISSISIISFVISSFKYFSFSLFLIRQLYYIMLYSVTFYFNFVFSAVLNLIVSYLFVFLIFYSILFPHFISYYSLHCFTNKSFFFYYFYYYLLSYKGEGEKSLFYIRLFLHHLLRSKH